MTAGARRARTEGIRLDLLDRQLRLRGPRGDVMRDVASRYAACVAASDAASARGAAPDVDIEIRSAADGSFALRAGDEPVVVATNAADLHHELDRAIVLALQRLRPDLYVIHAAVLSWRGRAFLIAGSSGDGKSTTAWGLVHHGAGFASDELAPIDLVDATVHPFARALCLKRDPPPRYPLPARALRIGSAVHIPTAALPCATERAPLSVAGMAFVRHEPGRARPALRPLSGAETAARLYAQALNALAHPERGFDAAAGLALRWPAVALESGELEASCEALGRWMESTLG